MHALVCIRLFIVTRSILTGFVFAEEKIGYNHQHQKRPPGKKENQEKEKCILVYEGEWISVLTSASVRATCVDSGKKHAACSIWSAYSLPTKFGDVVARVVLTVVIVIALANISFRFVSGMVQ